MRYRLAIFDLDGTLADSLPWFRGHVNDVADKFGFRRVAEEDIGPLRRAPPREILERLEVERERHGRRRNLVVAATGTGKTVIAALDYRRLRAARGGDMSLLFVAHRKEILDQSLRMFRHALRDGSFGETYVGGRRPDRWRHVFASVQSLATIDLATLAPDRFQMVIVDEFHHAAAATYRRLLDHLEPEILLGLTAMAVAAVSDGAYAVVTGRASAWLTRSRVRLVNRIGGVCLIGGGAWLALTRAR